MKKCISTLIILALILAGCSGVVQSSSKTNLPSSSPLNTVRGYLEALKNNDFGGAYEYISSGYAGNLDRESYELNMRKGLVQRFNWSLLDYEVNAVNMLGSQAFVIAELDLRFKSPESGEQAQKKVEIQYSLYPLRNEWKITADNCINNCIASFGISGENVETTDFK